MAQFPSGLPVVFVERSQAEGWAWDYRTHEPFRVAAMGEVLTGEAQWLRVLGEDVLHVFERNAVSGTYARAACGRYFVAAIDRSVNVSERHMKCVGCDELLPEAARGPVKPWVEVPAVEVPAVDYEAEALCARLLIGAMTRGNVAQQNRIWDVWKAERDTNIAKGPLGRVVEDAATWAELDARRAARATPRAGDSIAEAFADVPPASSEGGHGE